MLPAPQSSLRRVVLGVLVALGACAAAIAVARRARAELPAPPPEIAVGKSLPDWALPDDEGRTVSLSSLRGQPTVLMFFRGVFCASCRAQIERLGRRANDLTASGVRVFGVSPDPPDVSARWRREVRLPFPLLSDAHQRLAPTLCGANAHCIVLVGADGAVAWGALTDGWRDGVEPARILAAAERLARHR